MAANSFREAEIQTTEKDHREKPYEPWPAGSGNNVTSQDEVNENAPAPDGVFNELDDPTLPLNWSIQKKFFNMVVPSILCLVMYLSFVFLSLKKPLLIHQTAAPSGLLSALQPSQTSYSALVSPKLLRSSLSRLTR